MPPGLKFWIITSARAGQLAGQREVGLLAQVEDDRALAAVDAEEVRRHALALGRAPRAGLVAGRRPLDLDHVGAHVGEQHRGVGTGQHPGEVGHQQPGSGPTCCAIVSPDRSTDACPPSIMPPPLRGRPSEPGEVGADVAGRALAAAAGGGRAARSTEVSAAWVLTLSAAMTRSLAVAHRRGHRPDPERQLLVGHRPPAGPHLAQHLVALLAVGLPQRRQPRPGRLGQDLLERGRASSAASSTLPSEVGSAGNRVPICTDRATILGTATRAT